MLNFKKPVFAFSLAVLATQIAWAEPAKKPPVLAGMTILLDATDINGDGTVDTGPKNIVDEKGGVGLWQNKSTLNGGKAVAANNFFSIDASKKPKWVAGNLNGKTVISFKNGGFKTSSLTQIPANSNYTKFIVFKLNNDIQDYKHNNLISSNYTALWTGQAEGATAEVKGVLRAWHDPENYLSDSTNKKVEVKDFHIASTRYAKGVPVITPALPNVLRLDSTEVAFNSLSKPHAESVTFIGAGNEQNKFLLEGEIAEIIVYNRALSNADITKVEKYLKDKWGGFKPNKITTFNIGTAKKEKGKTINLTAKASTGLPVIFSSLSKSICKIGKNEKSVELLAIGKCIVTAGQVGNKTYRSAETLVKDFEVVAVTKPTTPTTPPKSSGGGGGSTAPVLLMLLGFVSLLRRKLSLR